MVRYSTIVDIIEKHITKCSNDEVKAKLEMLTQEEIREKLEKHMNPAEMEAYERIIEMKKLYTRLLEAHIKAKTGEEGYYQNQIDEYTEKGFRYEKRIFQGHKPHIPKPVDYDLNDYNGEEEKQINAQKEVEFTEQEQESLQSYFGSGYKELNEKLYKGEKLSDEENPKGVLFGGGSQSLAEKSRNLSNAIRRTSLEENTIVYHGGGHFNPSSVVGDTINFKGFTSCSYERIVAKVFNPNSGYIYKIALPSGTHGFCANAPVGDDELILTNHYSEHELLLDKGFKGRIADIDYENHEVTIIPA